MVGFVETARIVIRPVTCATRTGLPGSRRRATFLHAPLILRGSALHDSRFRFAEPIRFVIRSVTCAARTGTRRQATSPHTPLLRLESALRDSSRRPRPNPDCSGVHHLLVPDRHVAVVTVLSDWMLLQALRRASLFGANPNLGPACPAHSHSRLTLDTTFTNAFTMSCISRSPELRCAWGWYVAVGARAGRLWVLLGHKVSPTSLRDCSSQGLASDPGSKYLAHGPNVSRSINPGGSTPRNPAPVCPVQVSMTSSTAQTSRSPRYSATSSPASAASLSSTPYTPCLPLRLPFFHATLRCATCKRSSPGPVARSSQTISCRNSSPVLCCPCYCLCPFLWLFLWLTLRPAPCPITPRSHFLCAPLSLRSPSGRTCGASALGSREWPASP